jgi:ribosomal protein S18 acetylase RimI-like enzyme
MPDPLDNPIWHALIGPHASIALGRGAARRYPPKISPFSAIAEPTPAAYADLAADLPPGAHAALFRPAEEPAPPGWETINTRPIEQMILPATALPSHALPAESRATPLSLDDVPEMLTLIEMTRPGPFAPRTVELGDYIGVRDPNGRLIAMAGERLRLTGHAEISAVCVHPDARGQGLAAALIFRAARAIVARGQTPFLHVFPDNPALELYTQLGFRPRATLWVIWRRQSAIA